MRFTPVLIKFGYENVDAKDYFADTALFGYHRMSETCQIKRNSATSGEFTLIEIDSKNI